MNMIRNLLAIVIALAVAGCEPARYPWFAKEGATFDQQQKDEYECERETRTARFESHFAMADFAIRCMSVRGYTLHR
ncbi:MAG TPA: hypothetical protein VK634_19760 [Reyranella sp.]|nr:hypothetical protein [Reyranella sp.]HTE82932.1 hypothetical protein [Reyranella sp.]